MRKNVPRRSMLIFGAMLLLLTGLVAGCSSDDGEKQEAIDRADRLEVDVANLEARASELEQQLAAAQAATPAATDGSAVAGQDWSTDRGPVTVKILGAIADAPPRVRPEPTPTPEGYVPPPPPTPPAPQVRDLTFYVDTVTAGAGESEYNVDGNLLCTRTSAFARGMHVVWRMYVYDNTGTEVQGDRIDVATVTIPGIADPVNFRYSRHGSNDDSPWFFTAAWDIPPDYPLGAIDYTIDVATTDGLVAQFKEIPVSSPDRGIESRLQVIE